MQRTRSRERLVACGAAAAIWLAVTAGPVVARDAGRPFDIPSQDGASALNAFAAQSGLNILFPYRAAASRQSRPIKGDLPSKTVLRQLLDDTGLRIVRQRNGVITLGERRAAAALPEERPGGSAVVAAPARAPSVGPQGEGAPEPVETIAAPPLPTPLARDIIVTAQRRPNGWRMRRRRSSCSAARISRSRG